MRKPNLIAFFAVIGIVASAIALYITQFRNLSPNTNLSEGLGIAAATETARVLGNQGRVILIVAEARSQNPDRTTQQGAFIKALAQKKGMTLLAAEPLEIERPGTMGDDGLNQDQFLAILKRHATADAFVSLVGFPPLPKEALEEIKGRKFIVIGNAGAELRRRLQEGVVQVGIIPRVQSTGTTAKPRTSQEWFNLTHEIVTPENVGPRP